jgi:hypothetical protein
LIKSLIRASPLSQLEHPVPRETLIITNLSGDDGRNWGGQMYLIALRRIFARNVILASFRPEPVIIHRTTEVGG